MGHAPAILNEIKHPPLHVFGIQIPRSEPLKEAGQAKQKSGGPKAGTGDVRAGCNAGVEDKLTVAPTVAGDTNVLRAPDIGSPFQAMVAGNFGPVVSKLINLLFFP